MSKIIQIGNDTVSIGLDDGTIKEVPSNSLNFMPSVGDEVQVFENGEKIIVTKVEKAAQVQQPQIVINNANTNSNVNTNTNVVGGRAGNPRNKWVALCLCIFLGWLGAHKFYDGKIVMGIVYIFTVGLFGIGIIIDLISILTRPNPYYVSY